MSDRWSKYLKKTNAEALLILSWLANFAYMDYNNIEDIEVKNKLKDQFNYELVHVDNCPEALKVFENAEEKQLIISISGSKHAEDFIDCCQRQTGAVTVKNLGVVHGGVSEVCDMYYNTVLSLVFKYIDFQIIFTGHSLGGAISHLLYWKLKTEFKERANNFYHVGIASLRYVVLEEEYKHDPHAVTNTFEEDLVIKIEESTLQSIMEHLSTFISWFKKSKKKVDPEAEIIAASKKMKMPEEVEISEEDRIDCTNRYEKSLNNDTLEQEAERVRRLAQKEVEKQRPFEILRLLQSLNEENVESVKLELSKYSLHDLSNFALLYTAHIPSEETHNNRPHEHNTPLFGYKLPAPKISDKTPLQESEQGKLMMRIIGRPGCLAKVDDTSSIFVKIIEFIYSPVERHQLVTYTRFFIGLYLFSNDKDQRVALEGSLEE